MSLTNTGVSEQFAEIYIGHCGVVGIDCPCDMSQAVINQKDFSAAEMFFFCFFLFLFFSSL